MTAEVAIANASAIALAADSAVTIGDQKIYNSALKLFSLSKIAPIGVMVYGNAGLLRVPWETIIKTYRQKHGGEKHNSLQEYAENFLEYLNDSPELFPDSAQKAWLQGNVRGYYTLIRDSFFEVLHQTFQEQGEITNEEAAEKLRSTVASYHSKLRGAEYADGMSEGFEKEVRSKYLKEFKKWKDNIFENTPIASATAAKLYDIGTFIHTRTVFSAGVSGLVIAGYGEAEIYPSILAFDVEGVVENKLKYKKNCQKSHTIKSGDDCKIIAFAQEDMVATFMNGINPQVAYFIQSYLNKLLQRLPELLNSENISSEDRKRFSKEVTMLLEGFTRAFREHLQSEHVQPVMRMVTVLPKDELASMAEALVNLTAFKRRITESMETVGGPIDVAVISKGDGLIWVKRKHYFPADLNQHFFANYFRGFNDEKANEE
ncbi:hypothetical protein HG263_14130 [Pseudoalteromonas sp. JBTF-M23]|uniref:Uncharacterized protein n=1 Tax=Pseudoalteromonas caenipelagi TaxID=2726988 RepID=A0A849VFU8_9GAMM|nr:hypothetical protein [Pseudoalteromonas caenipelagi]NOU51670.1 hypothetical protein [Pseudoalteromonas caenipelagi]